VAVVKLGEQLTGGLGAGGVPDIGRQAAEESLPAISAAVANADMVGNNRYSECSCRLGMTLSVGTLLELPFRRSENILALTTATSISATRQFAACFSPILFTVHG